MAESLAATLASVHADAELPSAEWDWKAIDDAAFGQFNLRLHLPEAEREGLRPDGLEDILLERVTGAYEQREQLFGSPVMRHLERLIFLQTLDTLWRQHLIDMEHLKEGIGLRGYAQVNPLQAYQKEGYDMFEALVRRMESDVIEKLMSVQLQTQARGAQAHVAVEGAEELELPAAIVDMERRQRATQRMTLTHGHEHAQPQKIETVRRDGDKVGRNDQCPCGSGKKYKKCHGRA
jgi:preprotein translocase subunit SecA